MPSFADSFSALTGTCPFVRIGIAVGALAAALIPSAPRAAPAKDAIPVFTPISNSAWQANFWDYILCRHLKAPDMDRYGRIQRTRIIVRSKTARSFAAAS